MSKHNRERRRQQQRQQRHQDPSLHLTEVGEYELGAVLDLYRQLLGREPTAAEVAEAKAVLAEEGGGGRQHER
jgi:hypothetical protein